MIKISFVLLDGRKLEVSAAEGSTLMEVAVLNDIPGIDGDCGGVCACATCHIHVDKAWIPFLKEIDEIEQDMLDFACDIGKNSRLSCQIQLEKSLDGLLVYVPKCLF